MCIYVFVKEFFFISIYGIQEIEGFPDGSVVNNSPVNAGNAGDAGLIPGLGRSPGEGNG